MASKERVCIPPQRATAAAVEAADVDAQERRRRIAAWYASPVDVGNGVVVRVRLSPRAWNLEKALALREELRVAGLSEDGPPLPQIPDTVTTESAERAAEQLEKSVRDVNNFMADQRARSEAEGRAEMAAVRALSVSVESSTIEGVTLDDALATPEMVEKIIEAIKASATAKEKKGEAGASPLASGQNGEAAVVPN